MSTTLQDVANLLDFTEKGKKTDKAVYGEVKAINPDKTYQVSLNGSDTTVKCARLSGAKVGDTVLVEILGNGYAVVTGTVGGDTDASDAQRSAAAAQEAAGEAQTAASAAQTSAQAAETAANQAVQDAAAASQAAATADSKATAAGTAAAAAQTSADDAAAAASTADSKATAASAAASRAETSATEAKTSASNASEYAARALGNLSTVESVTETLNWITQHGTMTLTTDTVLDPTHVYFVQDNNGDYTVGGVKYAVVTEPDVADIATYYELSIDQSLNNYVATHLAVDSEGLWIIPDAGGNKVLIATGQGDAYTSAGTYIVREVDNVDRVLAKFTADGAFIGDQNVGLVSIENDGLELYGGGALGRLFSVKSTSATAIYTETFTDNVNKYIDTSTFYKIPLKGVPVLNDTVSITIEAKTTETATTTETYTGTFSVDSSGGYTEIGTTGFMFRVVYIRDEGYIAIRGKSSSILSKYYVLSVTVSYNAEGNAPSYIMGTASAILGAFSAIIGLALCASQDNQIAIGKYNDNQTDTAFEIGNGTSDTARSNAFDVAWDGETRLALDTAATSGTDADLYSAISTLGWTSDVIE